MLDYGGEKSYDPTPHRREEARKKGHVSKSQDLTSAALLLFALTCLLMFGGGLVDFLGAYSAEKLGGTPWLRIDPQAFCIEFNDTVWDLAKYMLPILGLLLGAAVLINLMQVGFLYVPGKITPDLTRIDPLRGLQRIFSLSGLARFGFGLLKVAIIFAVACVSLYRQRYQIVSLCDLELAVVCWLIMEILFWTAVKIGFALTVLAMLDYAYQRWQHEQDIKMTREEVREEMKNLEGNSEITARRRMLHRQLGPNRLSEALQKADVVITDSNGFATAIQYEPDTMQAPVVLAKGAGTVADQMRQAALENDVTVVERGPLAEVLYRDIEINNPVPSDKYADVADVLAYVYQAKGKAIPD